MTAIIALLVILFVISALALIRLERDERDKKGKKCGEDWASGISNPGPSDGTLKYFPIGPEDMRRYFYGGPMYYGKAQGREPGAAMAGEREKQQELALTAAVKG